MVCDSCKEREATVHLTQVLKGQVKKLHLCQECAEHNGINVDGPMSLTDVLFGLGMPSEPEPGDDQKKCPRCGMSRADVKKTQRLGCPACYDAFVEELQAMLASMQKGAQHVGKAPVSSAPWTPEMERMQKDLRHAVAEERYEEAARLRDLIREEKQKLPPSPGRRGDGG